MTAPGFVPHPDLSLVDRVATIEKRLRSMQQATAGTTTASVPLGNVAGLPIGPAALVGTLTSSAHSDHVHTSSLATQQDCLISSPSSGQLLQYTGSAWANTTPAAPNPNGQVLGGAGLAGTPFGTTIYTSGSSELDMPKLAVTANTVAGRAYIMNLFAYAHPSAANSVFYFRVRLNTPVTGTQLTAFSMEMPVGGWDVVLSWSAPWIATVNGSQSFRYSVALGAGSGTTTVGAGSAAWITDGGPGSLWNYT